jgi:7,8-dihydropterin-6-yl-methyl-4-(beta-D-ribofuranosyl)aminobenzene 5'-phosphate synthase
MEFSVTLNKFTYRPIGIIHSEHTSAGKTPVTGIDKVHVVMGSFHLSGPLFEAIIDRTSQELQKVHPAYIVLMHCTGRKAIMAIEKQMPEQFILNMSGTKLTFVS